MTTIAKGLKDKSLTNPRLVPRPTAASAARAARNATNRNLPTPSVRQSPNRIYPLSPRLQVKNAQRTQKSDDLKIDVKVRHNELDDAHFHNKMPTVELKTYDVKSSPVAVKEPYDKNADDEATRGVHEPFISNSELNDTNFVDFVHSEGDNQKPSEYNLQLDGHKIESKGHAQTPTILSRPETPKSLRSSRPQTPHSSSRPTTPAHPTQRHGTPNSCPNTPQSAYSSRPKTPSFNMPPNSRGLSPNEGSPSRSIREEEDIKSTFIMKHKEFQCLKRELDLKQQRVLEAFDKLRELRDEMSREGITGCGEGQLQELVVFNVADWSSEEILQLLHNGGASIADDAAEVINNKLNTLPIDECAHADLDAKILDVPARFADLCLQAFTARQEIIDWVKELLEKDENGSGESLERIANYNSHGLELCESLREMKSTAEGAVKAICQLSRRALQERSTLFALGESLLREVAHLRQDIEFHSNTIRELQENYQPNDSDRSKALEEVRREFEEERTMHIAAKEKQATTDAQLRQARMRINKMDRQLREAEASISSLTGTVKTLEDQSRQREVQLEARARKLKESLKTGEITSNHLAQHRDNLQAEILDLKQQIESMTAQHKVTITELNNQLKEVKNTLEQQYNTNQTETQQKKAAEAALTEAQNNIDELKNKVTELEKSKPNPDLPTEREMDLWAELQSTRDALRMTEDEVTACKREKIRFLETLTKITESDNKVGMQQKLAAELLSKEEILGKMQIQIRDLTKNIKLNEQKVIQYEQYVRDLQAHNRAVANCQESSNEIVYQDLQQEIMNLRMSLLEAVHRNEETSEQLMQKEQQLEQQDKTSRAQARVIKVREELINMLKNKETEQSRELSALQQDLEHRMKIVDEVNKQIAAKADEIQELFSTLENKQQQIHRLEKIVLALEEQQRRAQAQRTRHEEKIAALEHELAASGNRRERKFLFF